MKNTAPGPVETGLIDVYWHNSTWMKVWENWLQLQQALDQYRQSKEFLQLIDEVERMLRK